MSTVALTNAERMKAPTYATVAINDFLARLGGMTPYNTPRYRLVLAESVMTLEGGHFLIWPENATLQERGGIAYQFDEMGRPVATPSELRPIRVESGVKLLTKYPGLAGWILERWYPSSCYGTPESWNAQCLSDGTPLLGPYPERGDYEIVAGPAAEAPTETELKSIVLKIESSVANRKGTLWSRTQERVDRAMWKARRDEETAKHENFKRIQAETWFTRSSSLEAGRERERVAARIRAKGGKIGHVGS